MAGLASAFRAVADICNRIHGSTNAITLTRVGGSATPTDATLYRERTEWRNSANGREQLIVRKAVLMPSVADVPIGSTFTADGLAYTVEMVSTDHVGSQVLKGTRSASATVSRPGYYDRSTRFNRS